MWHILLVYVFCALGSASELSAAFNVKKIEKQTVAINERDYKQAVKIQLEKVEQASLEKKSAYSVELALLYLKDQDQELAFKAFLKALKQAQPPSSSPLFDENEYNKAFKIYLDPQSESPQATAKKMIAELIPILNDKPDQYLLDYFVAIAYANLGKYEEFFNHFYKAYLFYPNHYLAYKTKAVLNIKILERTRGDEAREAQKQAIIDDLTLASEKEPLDTTIYKLRISFSPAKKKSDQVRLCLNKIINDNIIIPRSELMFYVIEAVDINDNNLAQRFIDRANGWYPRSRIVTATQRYLDAHK